MEKTKRGMIFVFIFLFLISTIAATGICSLDKTQYSPGETATVSCDCTSPLEEGQSGYFVWKNDTNDILRSVATNSLTCRTSIFGDMLTVPSEEYLGNVTFSLDANGSGDPINWDDVDDITTDNFNVSGFSIFDCLIQDVQGSSTIDLGRVGAVEFNVRDPTTDLAMIHASCQVHAYDVDDAPLVLEPNEPGHLGFKVSTADGEVQFTHLMDEEFWETNTTYLWEFHCYSLPNETYAHVEHISYLENGNAAGMKTCTTEMLFTTGTEDYRANDNIARGLMYFLLILVFAGLAFAYHELGEEIDFEKWNNCIYKKYETKNYVKLALSAIGYNIMKNQFVVYYLVCFPIVAALTEIASTYNLASLIGIMQVISMVYIIGVVLVGILFLSYIQEWFMELLNKVRDMDWGIEK